MHSFKITSLCLILAAPVLAGDMTALDDAIAYSISHHEMPGAVVLAVHQDCIVFHKAYGSQSLQPTHVAMSLNAVFDLASLTKPIATATSIMVLLEQGKLRLSDRVAQHWPAFGKDGKERITIEHLLLHTSGLLADNPESNYREGRAKSLERICDLKPLAEPGARFIYSDVGFIVLGELVERISGIPLDAFVQFHLFGPLGMKETGFRPRAQDRPSLNLPIERFAPTHRREERWMIGEVHDPRSYDLGGVAGHAGLFSTASDLARYARMILNGGSLDGKRVLGPLTVRLMTAPRTVPGGSRAYGWDVNTRYSSNRGELFPVGESFGHTGFTGTSIWIHPVSQSAVIFLSNRLHPDGKGNVTRIRGQAATILAAHFAKLQAASPSQALSAVARNDRREVLTGIDVLVRERFQRLKGRKIGLVTNHTGQDRQGRAVIDLLHQAEGVKLVALFSPEHGIRGALDEKVSDSKDEKTGLPIFSLYGTRRKPTPETLQGIDTLVYDIQDAGCRYYTYISTLGGVMEAAAEAGLKVIVLDRPNPIGGVEVAGPMLDPGRESFVAYHRLPVRHGLTVGELALLYNAEHLTKAGKPIGADLEVVRMEGWRRGDLFDRTGLTWINPSPNLRGLTAALLYPGIGLLETTNLSVGRGTDRPFEWIGAPWLDGSKLAAALAQQALSGVRFVPSSLTPVSSVHKGKLCGGMQIIVDDWKRFEPLGTGFAIATTLRRLYPKEWTVDRYDALLGNKVILESLKRGASWQELEAAWRPELERFRETRMKYLLYPD